MLWTIEFGGDPQDVTVTTEGEATPEGFARMNAELAEDERFGPGMLVLVDHTRLLVHELSERKVRTISHEFAESEAELRSAIVAIVAPRPVQFGLARMSTMIAEPQTSAVCVFYTRAEALAWLRQMRGNGADATS